MSYVNPYEQSAHREWVASGRCDAIHWTKAWCSGTAGHVTEHWAPRPGAGAGGQETGRMYWGDGDNHAK